MRLKTKVVIIFKDPYNDYFEGETGYIDGYVRGGDDVPYAVVVIGDKLVMAPLRHLKVIQ